jgi:hypothetical protein
VLDHFRAQSMAERTADVYRAAMARSVRPA